MLLTERESSKELILKYKESLSKLHQLQTVNIQLQDECKIRGAREPNPREVISMFTHSSKIMDKMVDMQIPLNDKTGIGFEACSSSQATMTKEPASLVNKGVKALVFVRSQENVARPGLGYKGKGSIENGVQKNTYK